MNRWMRLVRLSWKRYLRLVQRPLTDEQWVTNQMW